MVDPNLDQPLYHYWSEAAECDFEPGNGLRSKLLTQSGIRTATPRCVRKAYHPGGRNCESGFSKKERKILVRRARQECRVQLLMAARMGVNSDFENVVVSRETSAGIVS